MSCISLVNGVAGGGGGGAVPVQSVTVTMPPMAAESDEEIMRDMGRVGFHLAGHYWLLGSTHYVWYTLDGAGWDPGVFLASLSGRTGILVPLTGGSRTAAQAATATATAIDAIAGLTATPSGAEVDIEGAGSASAGTVTVDTAGALGIRGMNTSNLAGLNNFGNVATSGVLLIDLPGAPIIITGFRMTAGDLHDDQVTVAVYQGGSADDDFDGATLVGVCGVTTGSNTLSNMYADTPDPFTLDPSLGRVWVLWSHDAGGFRAPYVIANETNPIHVAARDTSNWFVGASDLVSREISTIALTSDPADWPASLGAVTGSTTGMVTISLSFVTVSSFQTDMLAVGRIGTRAEAASLTGTSGATLLVGNSFDMPTTIGMTVFDAAVAYSVHASGSDYRLELAVGGAADDDFSGATWTDINVADGTDTGWVTVTPLAPVSIPASSRIFITIHHEDTAAGTLLAFDQGVPDAYGPPNDPAAYYNGNTSESEADDGTLGGTPSTNVEFDANIAQIGVITPNGTIYNNSNNVGVRMRYAVRGFEVAA